MGYKYRKGNNVQRSLDEAAEKNGYSLVREADKTGNIANLHLKAKAIRFKRYSGD